MAVRRDDVPVLARIPAFPCGDLALAPAVPEAAAPDRSETADAVGRPFGEQRCVQVGGYERAQQFTREYGRMFGLPPVRDTEAAKRLAESAA